MEDYLTEKEQWDRVLLWLREQGPWMVGAVAITALAFGGWRWWQSHIEQRNLAAEARYEQALEAFGRNDLAGGIKIADALIKDYPSTPYADQASLAAARVQVEDKQLDKAATRLSAVLQGTQDPELALIARLRLARVQLAMGRADDALKTLNAVNPGAFAARYAEVRGDVLLAKGDRDGALKEYRNARGDSATLDGGLLDLKISALAHS